MNAMGPYLNMELTDEVGIYTGLERGIEQIKQIVWESKNRLLEKQLAWGDLRHLYEPIQTCMAWNTIYEPSMRRVVTTVSRNWNIGKRGGYALFTWDGSQPPVGSMVCLELFTKFKDRWFLEEVFHDLLEWNRWWCRARQQGPLLCLGSNFYVSPVPSPQEIPRVYQLLGAACESGLEYAAKHKRNE